MSSFVKTNSQSFLDSTPKQDIKIALQRKKSLKMDDFNRHLQESLEDEAFKAEYEKEELRHKVIDMFINLRNKYKLKQTQLAQKIGTTQAVISRIERGNVNGKYRLLQKTAKAFGKKIDFKPS